jgi:hypothetical protein
MTRILKVIVSAIYATHVITSSLEIRAQMTSDKTRSSGYGYSRHGCTSSISKRRLLIAQKPDINVTKKAL